MSQVPPINAAARLPCGLHPSHCCGRGTCSVDAEGVLFMPALSGHMVRRTWAIETEPPIPSPLSTPEDFERAQNMADAMKARLEARVAAHPQRVAKASGVLAKLLELHAPVSEASWRDPHCAGCDTDGGDYPEWPCRTYCLIAGWEYWLDEVTITSVPVVAGWEEGQ